MSIPTPESVDWTVLTHPHAGIGEVPIYDPETKSLYWIDLFEPSLNRTGLDDGQTEGWALPATGGSYVLYDDGCGALVAVADGVYDLDFDSGELRLVHEAPFDVANHRFNDGRCDPAGRFWVGTMRLRGSTARSGSGYFYSIEAGRLTRMLDDVTIANGIAYSPDGTTMYLADAINRRILAYDYDVASGTATGKRVFTATADGEIPDGAAVDAAGGYWVAMFKSGEVRRYLPDGRLHRVLELPVTQPTMCAFGGPGLARLFVTTGRDFLTEDELAGQPLAGAILMADVGESGIPEPRFPRAR